MLFDLYSKNSYSFPFELFFNQFEPLSISYPKAYNYINRWREIFIKLETKTLKEYQYFNSIQKGNTKPYEYFQYSLDFPQFSSKFIFHFDIEKIKNNAKSIRKKHMFTKKISNSVCYDKTATDKFSLNTIIVCPFYHHSSNLLVIDGNHSLLSAIKYKIPFVRYIYYFPHSSDFVFSIEWAMYLFINEFASNTVFDESATLVLDDDFFVKQLKELME